MTARRAVVIMARWPEPGRTKTRLGATIGQEAAADLYRCLLLDTIDLVRSLAVGDEIDLVVAYDPSEPTVEAAFRQLAPDATLVAQDGPDLGHRLDQVMGWCLDAGYQQVAVLGSDSPTLPPATITAAFAALDADPSTVVLGPAADGGFYLIAASRTPGPLVTQVVMSTPRVLDDTLALAMEHGRPTKLLSPWYDIDEIDDLARIGPRPGSGEGPACRTRAMVEGLWPGPVAVVIPALDEEATIASIVARTRATGVAWVIVVDNGSTDRTAAVAAEAGAVVVDEKRRGYGFACAAGSAEALERGAAVVVYLDGDGSSRPEELPRLLTPLLAHDGTPGADLVLGSRVLGTIDRGAMGWHQRAGNLVSAWLMRRLYGLSVTDLGPYRAVTAELLRQLPMTEMTFGWPTEMTVTSANRGARIVEVPASWDRRGGGRSKVSGTIRGSILAARYILGVTLRHARWRRRAGASGAL